MAPKPILVDTGPLVALLRPDDSHHGTCVAEAKSLSYPLLTSWSVITEAAWLLRSTPNGVQTLLQQVEQGLVQPLELDAGAIPWIRVFLEQYRDLAAQLADASLCYLAEREGINTIFTLDRRDFSVYRTRQNQPFSLLPESVQPK